jgi:PadR family transcriptional regulator, regulatory protein PadR
MKGNTTKQEIRKGLLLLAVLRVIGREKSYAAEILSALNNTAFATQEGTLYPLLSRMKREGLIDHEWVESPGGPPRKYFVLSPDGKRRTEDLMEYVNELNVQLQELQPTKTKGTKR